MNRKIEILSTAVVFLLLFYVFYVLLPHQLFFQEQQNLFRFDGSFLCQSFSKIGGAAEYFGAFVAQFFYVEWIGAFVFAALLAALAFGLSRVVSARSPVGLDVLNLALIPLVVEIALFTKTTYTFELLFACYATLAAYGLWRVCRSNPIVGAVLVAGLYPLVGLYFVWFGVVILWAQPNWWRRVVGAVFLTLVPVVWAFVYFQPVAACYSDWSQWVFYGLCYLALLWLVVPRIKSKSVALWIISLSVWLVAGFAVLVGRYDVREKYMIEIDRALKQERWVDVLHYAERFGEPNVMVAYARNLSLLMLDRLPELMMNVPERYGIDALFIGRKGNQREMEYMDHIYAKLGLYNEAHRQAWESMTTYGLSASNATKLVRYNLRMGRVSVAEKFDRLLDRTLFYRGTLDRFKADSSDARPFEARSEKVHFVNVLNIGADLTYMFSQGARDKRTADYLLAALLLNNKVLVFADYLQQVIAHYPDSLPMLYQQALILWREGFDDQQLGVLSNRISTQAEEQYARYLAAYQAANGRASDLRAFADTYYFYIHFVSPYGSKLSRK